MLQDSLALGLPQLYQCSTSHGHFFAFITLALLVLVLGILWFSQIFLRATPAEAGGTAKIFSCQMCELGIISEGESSCLRRMWQQKQVGVCMPTRQVDLQRPRVGLKLPVKEKHLVDQALMSKEVTVGLVLTLIGEEKRFSASNLKDLMKCYQEQKVKLSVVSFFRAVWIILDRLNQVNSDKRNAIFLDAFFSSTGTSLK